MSTKSVIIAGEAFEITVPYVAGHTLTEGEAYHLNQLRCENIRNNTAKAIKEAKESGDQTKLDEARAAVAKKNAEYEFRVGGSSGDTAPKLDPIEREARKIAKSILVSKLAEKGLKIGTAPEGTTKEDWAAKMESNLAKIAATPEVLKAAEKAVKQAAKVRDEAAVDLDLG